METGAMTLAEGSQKKDYKTDASLVLNGTEKRGCVLRTACDPMSVWRAKHAKNVSPFYPKLKTGVKETALIGGKIWVFGIDGTNPCTCSSRLPESIPSRLMVGGTSAPMNPR